MKKRLLGAVTAIALLLGIFPAGTLSVFAASGVEYTRLLPEVAILNSYTGNNQSFYLSLKGALDGESGKTKSSYFHYNAMQGLYVGGGGAWSWGPTFDGSSDMSKSITWSPQELSGKSPSFAESTLKQVMKTDKNLYVKLSAEFQNYTHKHTFWKDVLPRQVEVHNFLSGRLSIGGNTTLSISGLDGVGLSNYRDGDDDAYYPLRYNSDDGGGITFTKAKLEYTSGKHCTCSGAKANHLLVTFRDDRAPQLSKVEYSSNGTSFGDRFSSAMKKQLGAGDTLYIKLKFDEPIRFSDDSELGKTGLNLGLKLQGKDVRDNMRAYLYKLDTDSLYFKYTVPSDLDLDEDIVSLDASSLYDSSKKLTLKQVVRQGGNFSIKDSTLSDLKITDSYGFNTTDCYITDLAGNAWEEKEISNAYLHIDTQAPTVERINWGLNLNNADVKEALGQSDKDNSDLYLGVGDSINMTIAMSEPLNLKLPETAEGYYLLDWKYGKATTNIKDRNDGDKYVTVTTRWFTPSYQNLHRLQNTVFVMQGLTITDGMYVEKTADNPNGEVRVTKFDLSAYGGDITDMRGNPLDKENVGINTGAGSNPPMVATDEPTVTAEGCNDTADGFRQAFTIKDNSGTGVAAIYGTFTLNQSGDGGKYRYLWAASASPETPESGWSSGVIGEAQRFIQHETTYIHIKKDEDENYVNLDSCVLTVNAKDFAGNTGSGSTGDGDISWYVDNLPPTAAAGDSTRSLNGDTGTLKVELTLRDSHGISGWQYGWSDDKEYEPSVWQDGTTAGSGSEISAEVTQTVPELESFGKYLWVKATDKCQNTSNPICLGYYAYDLSKAKYALKYTAAVTKLAELAVTELDADDSLVFAFTTDGDDIKEKSYYYKKVDAVTTNIFEESGWEKGTLTVADGIYTFNSTIVPNTGWMTNGEHSGNLEVMVLAGKAANLSTSENGVTTTVGSGAYKFSKENVSLRVTGSGDSAKYNYSIIDDGKMEYLQLRLLDDMQLHNEKEIWTGNEKLLSTLAGKQVEIVVLKDRYGWSCEDIDIQKSKVVLTNQDDATKKHELALTQFRKSEDGTWRQKLTIGGEFETGLYTATLSLALVNGESVEIAARDANGEMFLAPLTVDNTIPNENLKLSSIMYSHNADNAFGLNTVYQERNCVGEEDVTVLPMAGGYFDASGSTPSAFTYEVTFTSEGEEECGKLYYKNQSLWTYTGQYYVEVWTKENPDRIVKFYPRENSYTEAKSSNGADLCGITPLTAEEGQEISGMLYLTPDADNTICYRKVYSNGKTTAVRNHVVRPVSQYLEGEMSIKNNQLVFTPAFTVGEKTKLGATVYAFAYQNDDNWVYYQKSDNWKNGNGELIEMSYTAYGDWRCNLKENGAIYKILTINSDGSVWASAENDFLTQRAPWSNGVHYEDNKDGTYTASAWIYDDLNTIRKEGLDLEVSFNEEYCAEGYKIKVTEAMFDTGKYTYTEKTKGLSRNGIYEVYLEAGSQSEKYDYLYVKLCGVVQKQNAENQTEQNMKLTLRAIDAYGNRWEDSTEQKVKYCEPKVVGNALSENGLKLTFNQPVMPTDSWAYIESLAEETDYKAEWEGAFPVTSNGTHEVQFKDIFGNICEAEFTTEAFTTDDGNWSMDLTFSETELTCEAVKLTASLPYANTTALESGTSIRNDKGEILIPEGRYNGYPFPTNPTVYNRDGEWTSGNSGATSTPRTVSTEKNGYLKVGVYKNTFVNDTHAGLKYSQKVYINNIAKEAPTAELLYYSTVLGSEYTKAELEAYIAEQEDSLKLEDTIRVRYRTTRHVTATEDSGSEFYFTFDNQKESHIFSYQDDMGNTASVTAKLPDGLELVKPKEPYVDTTSPTVSVSIWYEYKGVYKEAEGFLAGETQDSIRDKVLNMGQVAACGFKITAHDESGFDISITPTDGVNLEGNMVTVRTAADVTVTVTDRSPAQNKTSVTLTEDMFAKLDSIPPTAEIWTEADGMYGRKVIIEMSDKDNSGNVTSTDENGNDAITLTSPQEAERIGTNKYEYSVTENGTVYFVFYDRAGNRNRNEGASAEVNGIDTNPPALTTTWAPPYTYYDDIEEKMVIDHSYPTTETVNTNVTAFIDSDKAMYNLSMDYGGDPIELLKKGVATAQNPYQILGQDDKVLATVSATSERITVVYEEYYAKELRFIASAANGKSETATVDGYVYIDKEAPNVNVSSTPLYRKKDEATSYTVPYAVKAKLTPDEVVYSPNYGGTESVDYGNGLEEDWKLYSEDYPLEITFTENGTYSVYISDRAGNSTVERITVSGIDRTAPVITLGDRTETGQSVTVPVTVDKASTVTANGNTIEFNAGDTKEITFTDNGTYEIAAVDAAGNTARRIITVGSIDKILPSIIFYTNTVYAIAGGDRTAAEEELENGYTVTDNKTKAENLEVTKDYSEVKWDTAGLYPVKYTVKDEAENVTEATRFVQIIGKNTVCVSVDGKVILPNSTAVLKAGNHKLELQNCTEPFSVKARKGIRSLGQMKKPAANSLTFDEDGSFDVSTNGYYTLQITTQSRKVIRILLCVEP